MKILQVEKLTNERWLNLFAAQWEHEERRGRWVFASRSEKPYSGPHNDAVLMVPILHQPGHPPRLVLLREYRIPAGDYTVSVPAGLIDPGESVEDAIHREMYEETGLKVTAIKRITQPLFTSTGLTDEMVSMAFIDVAGDDDAKPHPDGGEIIEVMLVDYEGVCRLCNDRSQLMDIKAWVILEMFQRLGKLE